MPYHIPVMLDQVVAYLNCRPGNIMVDGTLGGSGHARTICEKIRPGGTFIGIDEDADAIAHAKAVLASPQVTLHLVQDNFIHLPDILSAHQIDSVDGILLDLGLSLHQLEASGRGFSFSRDEPLDMRKNTASLKTAADLINTESESTLSNLFKTLGEERWAKRIARRVVAERKEQPIRTSGRLAQIVSKAVPRKAGANKRIHPATRVFMALRIAVNQELQNLETFMGVAGESLKPAGRLAVISFHSLEDRIVKQQMRAWAKGCICPPRSPQCVCRQTPEARILTPKPIRPAPQEISANPMARSAKLRVVEKLSQ